MNANEPMGQHDAGVAVNEAELRERLAALAHEQWSGWMEHLFRKTTAMGNGALIPPWAVERWKRQIETPYADLSEAEKESDRREADRYLAVLAPQLHQHARLEAEVRRLRASVEEKWALQAEALDRAIRAEKREQDRAAEVARLQDALQRAWAENDALRAPRPKWETPRLIEVASGPTPTGMEVDRGV